jgi:hypothetical protein
VFSFSSNAVDLPFEPGIYVVPMFEVKLEGFRVELYLAAVPVRLSDRKVHDCDFIKLPRQLGSSAIAGSRRSGFILDLEDPVAFIDLGREALERQMEEKMELLRSENSYRIDARINSLKRGSEVRIERLQKKIAEHSERAIADGREPSQEFIRLTEAQIAVEERRREEKIKKLKARSELSLTLSLAGAVVCEVSK